MKQKIFLFGVAIVGLIAVACGSPATPAPPVIQTVVVPVKETVVQTVKETVAVPETVVAQQTVVVQETAVPLPTQPPAGSMLQSIGQGEGEVDIIAWVGYIERGDNDKNYDWVTPFEKDSGCKVSVKIAGSSDEMVALMNEGGFDLVTASGDASNRLIAGKRVQEINTALIPSWSTVDSRLQNAPWNTVDGKHYGVPYQWGPNVLMYNTDTFKQAPKSWSVVFEEQNLPDGKSNKDRVEAYYGPIYVADAALYLMKHKPELGIKNPYELSRDQFNAAIELLTAQRQIVARYWNDSTRQMDDFISEGIVASTSWPYQVNVLQSQNKPIASVIPDEGATGWADTTMMAIEPKHPNCAYKWMEWSLNPKVQGDVAAWFGSVPAVPAACKGNALLTDTGCDTNGMQNFDKLWFWRTPTEKCETQTECVPYHEWVTAYVGVIGAK